MEFNAEVDRLLRLQMREVDVERAVLIKAQLFREFGDNTYPNTTVFRFSKTFAKGGTEFSYAAILAGDGMWYLTGPTQTAGMEWSEFVLWLVSGDFPVRHRDIEVFYPETVEGDDAS